ncbi:MAG: choice-of-anchor Q domain-containing protein [Kofleriaceae bacterium]
MGIRWALIFVAACGGGGGSSSGDDDGQPVPDAAVPSAVCTEPALADTSGAVVVGDGTAASCTMAALQTAASAGGAITFACGADPVTITMTAPIMVTKETVIDGGGKVTLSGGGTSRILYLDSDYNTKTPRLTVQRLSFVKGKSPATGEDTAQGGGAIYRDGGSLTVNQCAFDDNHGPTTGQDTAGGAIYGFGGGDIVIVKSTFTNNSCSDGGAVGSLNGDLSIIDSTFDGNTATGNGGNPGNGGCGGTIYQDGGKEMSSLCGVTITHSTAGAIGGGVFRVSNDHTGSFAMDRSVVDGGTVMGQGNAGGLYLEGLALTITASSITHNTAYNNGGIWISTDTVTIINTTIAENTASGTNGGGIWLGHSPTGTITNSTIANNHSTAPGNIAGAIFGDGLTLLNTVISGNTAQYTPGCDDTRIDGSGNLQFPSGALCTMSPTIADPMLGTIDPTTYTLAPAAGSPAKMLGRNCPATDQLGNPRGDACTAGAIE